MNLSDLIGKVLRLKCKQEFPTKKHKKLKLSKIPSILNLKKKYATFCIRHQFSDLNTPVILSDSGDSEIELILKYEFYSYSEIINVVCDRQMPVSYETVGDVIHFNLNDEYLHYKYLIGKILHDKTGCTIINKLGNISSQFRNYDFEYLGGKVEITDLENESELIDGITYTVQKNDNMVYDKEEVVDEQKIVNYKVDCTKLNKEDVNQVLLEKLFSLYVNKNKIIKIDRLETMLIENRARFLIDIKNVYWCSKLQDERKRLLGEIKQGDLVCDVFCGLGPMVIPLLLKKCVVYCNDLNGKAIDCLKRNLALNKVKTECHIDNLDAKLYLEKIKDVKIDHFILNLPEHSIDYLHYIKKGLIHCYFFSNEGEVDDLVYNKTGLRNLDIRFIRKVSPNKNVYKLTFYK